MAASDYVPIFFKNRLHLAGRPQMGSYPEPSLSNNLNLGQLRCPICAFAQSTVEPSRSSRDPH